MPLPHFIEFNQILISVQQRNLPSFSIESLQMYFLRIISIDYLFPSSYQGLMNLVYSDIITENI